MEVFGWASLQLNWGLLYYTLESINVPRPKIARQSCPKRLPLPERAAIFDPLPACTNEQRKYFQTGNYCSSPRRIAPPIAGAPEPWVKDSAR